MPDTPTTAAIAASATIISASITALVPQLLARSDEGKRFLRTSTMASVEGTWLGEGSDSFVENNTSLLPFELRLTLTTKRNKLIGRGELTNVHALLELEGGFFNDRYLQLSYRSVDPSRMQMGVIVLRLSADAKTISGHYAGFSPIRETFVMGHVSLRRMSL